jgi:hypothetical protein
MLSDAVDCNGIAGATGSNINSPALAIASIDMYKVTETGERTEEAMFVACVLRVQ